jgi:hypothetical protein
VVGGTMIEFLLSCLGIFLKWFIGGFIWMVVIFSLSVIIEVLFLKKNRKKPKYKGEPIVIKGGRDNE